MTWLALSLASFLASPAAAARVVGVLSSDLIHYRQAFEGFQEVWGSSAALGTAETPGADGFAAIGGKAAAARFPEGAVVVACLAPSAPPGVARISLLAAPAAVIERSRALLPRLKTLLVLWSSEAMREDLAALTAAAEARGVAVVSERVERPDSLPSLLRALTTPVDALWLMPDPALVNAENFAVLKEYSAAARVPFLAPTEGLVERGAAATIAVPFRDMGRAAGEVLRARLEGRAAPATTYSDRVVVVLNKPAARAAGVDLKAARGVDRSLE